MELLAELKGVVDPAIIQGLVTSVAPALFEKKILPMFDKMKNKKLVDKISIDSTRKEFIKYIKGTYENLSIMNTIVFKNRVININDVYIPLTVVKHMDKDFSYKLDNYNCGLFHSQCKILIVDTAGMGKSTLLKKMFLSAVESEIGIPVFIDLKKVEKEKDILAYVSKMIFNKDITLFDECLSLLLNQGEMTFFMDGFDEVGIEYKNLIISDIKNLIQCYPKNSFIITSRNEESLSAYGEFYRCSIEPLSINESFELIRKYDGLQESVNYADLLIDKLSEDVNLNLLKEFLTNPLMVTLLYKSFSYKKNIPYKKTIFYSQVYSALYDEHDLSKGHLDIHVKKSKLDIDDFNQVLRGLGYLSFLRNTVMFERELLINYLNEVKTKLFNNLQFSNNDFIEDILLNVPLFVKDGVYYRWVHKSFYEYFSALCIRFDLGSNGDKILNSIYSSANRERAYNLLDFMFDLDRDKFNRSILIPFISDYVSFVEEYKENYSKFELPEIDISKRINLMFVKNNVIVSIGSVKNNGKGSVKRMNLDSKKTQMVNELFWSYIRENNENVNHASYMEISSGNYLFSFSNKNIDILHLLNTKNCDELLQENCYSIKSYNSIIRNKVQFSNLSSGTTIPVNSLDYINNYETIDNFKKNTEAMLYLSSLESIKFLDLSKCKYFLGNITIESNDIDLFVFNSLT